MNRQEAAQVLELRQHLWPHTPKADDPAAEVDTWAKILAPYTPLEVVAAMRSKRDEAYPPTVGQIEEALDPVPTADAVWAEMEQMHARGYSTHDVDAVPWSSPLMMQIARLGYWRRYGEAPDPHYDEFSGANRANYRKAFVAEVQAVITQHRRLRAGLQPAERAALPPVAIEVAARMQGIE